MTVILRPDNISRRDSVRLQRATTETGSGPTARGRVERGAAALGMTSLTLLALAAVVGVVRSLGWGIAHDSSLMLFVAGMIDAGAVPYRDVFDMNWPGAHLVHLAFLRAFGDSDLAWRALDLAALGATAAVGFALLRPTGLAGAVLAATMIVVSHLLNGEYDVGQRDVLIAALLMWSSALLVSTRGPLAAFVVGLAIGAAATIKPIAAAYGIAAALLPRTGGPALHPRPRDLAALAGGAALAGAGVIAWLARRGGLEAFGAVMTGFVLPHYGALGRIPWGQSGDDIATAQAPLLPILVFGLYGVVRGGRDPVRAVAAALTLYGGFHFFIQGKGWLYHAAPLLLGLALGAGRALNATRVASAPIRLTVAALLAITVAIAMKPLLLLKPSVPAILSARLAADLEALTEPGERVQTLDTTDGAVDALRRTGRRLATPYFYDFPFFAAAPDDPFVAGLRADLLNRLAQDPPRVIVVTAQQWPLTRRGYERITGWREFTSFLATHYQAPIQRDLADGTSYRIHVRSPLDH